MQIDEMTYAGLLRNPEFLNKASNVLGHTFGEFDYNNNEELLDAFYEKFREIDSNEMDAYKLWSTVSSNEISDNQKVELKEVYEVYRALPMFYEDDTASNTKAFVDYLMSAVTAPSTYLSVVTGGAAGFATKAAMYGGVRAGLKSALDVGAKASLNSTLAGVATDTFGAFLGDAALQGAERSINYRYGDAFEDDEELSYDPVRGATAAASAIIPGAGFAAVGRGVKKLFKSEDYIKVIEEGKRIYLENTPAGQAFLNGNITEGSFVNIGKTKADKNIGYVFKVNDDDTYTLNMGFDLKTGDPIQKTVKTSEVKVLDPFDNAIQKKIQKEIIRDSELFNKELAEEGFKDLQEQMKKYFDLNDKDLPNLVDFKLTTNSMKRINDAFVDILQESKMMYNPNKRISQQVSDAIENVPNGFNSDDFVRILDANGVSNIEFISFMQGSYLGTTSQAAKVLGQASQVKKKVSKLWIEQFNQGLQKNFKDVTGKLYSEGDLEAAAKNPLKYASDVLGKNSQELSPATEAYYSSMLAERARLDHWGKGPDGALYERGSQWNRMVRLGMISQPATTIRNVMGGMIRIPVDMTTRTIDNLLTMALPMIGGGPRHRPVELKDAFDHVNSMFNAQENRLFVDFLASQKPEIRKLLDGPEGVYEAAQVQNVISKMEGNKKGIINRGIGVAFDPLENMLMKANILNSAQDRYMKSASFMVGLKQSMAREGLDIFKMVREGRIQEIDDRFINDGIQWALEYNYQTRNISEGPIGRKFSDVLYSMSNIPVVGSMAIPFPKFLINSFKFMYEHSPLSLLNPITAGKYKDLFSVNATPFQKEMAVKRISQGLSGTALLTTAYAARNSDYAGTEWNLYEDKTPGQLDISTWYPFAPYSFIAEVIKQTVDEKQNIFGVEFTIPGGEGRFDLKEKTRLDFIKALGGPSSRSGIMRQLEAHSLDFLFDEDPMSMVKFKQALARAAGSIVAALIIPLKLIKDIADELLYDPTTNTFDENIRILRKAQSSQGFFENFVDVILKDLPMGNSLLTYQDHGIRKLPNGQLQIIENENYKVSNDGGVQVPRSRYKIYRPTPLRNVAPLYKQFTGIIKKQRMGKVEREISRLGLVDWKLFRPSGIPEYDDAFELIGSSLIERNLNEFVSTNAAYRDFNDEFKAIYLKKEIGNLKRRLSEKFPSIHHLGIIKQVSKAKPYQFQKALKSAQAVGLIGEDVETVLDVNKQEATLLKELIEIYKKIPEEYNK
tara:strand:+ start:5136 stop:8849 length:3714 start_codon:yes stop_codon:yes gene_type:complete